MSEDGSCIHAPLQCVLFSLTHVCCIHVLCTAPAFDILLCLCFFRSCATVLPRCNFPPFWLPEELPSVHQLNMIMPQVFVGKSRHFNRKNVGNCPWFLQFQSEIDEIFGRTKQLDSFVFCGGPFLRFGVIVRSLTTIQRPSLMMYTQVYLTLMQCGAANV
jgi:hypothetical protein